MSIRKILPAIGLVGLFALVSAAEKKVEFSPRETFAKVNFAKKTPVIDGKISNGEYTGSYENFGLLKHNNDYLASRQGRVFAALDN